MSLTIYLSHYQNPELGIAWENEFEFCKDVKLVDTDLLKINCDAIVSPGNSFGFMDGGVDLAIVNQFGWKVQSELKEKISELPLKELLIGQSITIETETDKVKYVICAPTMRIPTNHNISSSINAYLAMKTALQSAFDNPNINSVAFTGLCTGTGKMLLQTSAKQMYAAYEEVILNKNREFPTFMDASKFHRYLNPLK
jgi:O-acetyl-ADP-ribose deacetylase (regulator of RNase III)